MRELEALYRADSELYRYLDLDDVLQALVNIAVDTLQADKSALLVWNPEREQWVTRAARGFGPETISLLSFARAEGTIGHAAAARKPVIVHGFMTAEDMRTVIERVPPEGLCLVSRVDAVEDVLRLQDALIR